VLKCAQADTAARFRIHGRRRAELFFLEQFGVIHHRVPAVAPPPKKE
jgi:hypothetical protein